MCSHFLHEGVFGGSDYWGPSVEEFNKKFDLKVTNGESSQYLRNIYFVYLVELRAIKKATPYLQRQTFFTGDQGADTETKVLVDQILGMINGFKSDFDETKMFRGNPSEANKLKVLDFIRAIRLHNAFIFSYRNSSKSSFET